MFERFRHRHWEPETLPEVSGSNGRLQIVMNNLPCLHDPDSGERRFLSSDFGSQLLVKLCVEQLTDLDHLRRVVSTGHKTVYVRLGGQPPVTVHVAGQIPQDPEQFCCDVAACLVSAFRAQHLLH